MSDNSGKIRALYDRLNRRESICVMCAIELLLSEKGGGIKPIPGATKEEILAAAELAEKLEAHQTPERPDFFKEVSAFMRCNISALMEEGNEQ